MLDDTPTNAILQQIHDLGYEVSLHEVYSTTVHNGTLTEVPPYIEIHAVRSSSPAERRIVRCVDGIGPDEAYAAACELARMVGIDLTT